MQSGPNKLKDGVIDEELFRAIFENSFDAMLITSPDGRIHRANAEACRVLEMSEREVCEAGRARVVDETDRRLGELLVERIRAGRCRGTVLFRRKDGRKFPAEFSSAVFQDQKGEQKTIIVFRDVTERGRAQLERARLAAIVESSEDAVIGKLPDGTITSWNLAAERLYGYTEAEAVGRSIRMIVPADKADEFDALLARVALGDRVRSFETQRRRKDGRLVEVALTVSPIQNAAGQIAGVATIAHDISERKRADEERERLVQELQRALAEVKALSGLLPICANCKKIRDDKGRWNQIEAYIRDHSQAEFSHGICPECFRKLYPEFLRLDAEQKDHNEGS